MIFAISNPVEVASLFRPTPTAGCRSAVANRSGGGLPQFAIVLALTIVMAHVD